MGCSSSNVHVIENVQKKEDLMLILYLKIYKLIKGNPFYDIPISKFKSTLDPLNDKVIKGEEYVSNENIIEEIISKYLESQENFIKILFKDVLNEAILKFKNLFPYDKDIIIIILYLLYIFLSNNQAGKRELFKKQIAILIKKIKNETNKENELKVSSIFLLLINIVQLFSFSFGCFFVFFTFLDNFEDYNKNKFKELFNNKNTIVKDVESILNDNLNNINKNISNSFLNVLVLSELNNKIKFLFENINKEEDLIILEDNQINIISDSLFECININNYVEFLFFGENHDY